MTHDDDDDDDEEEEGEKHWLKQHNLVILLYMIHSRYQNIQEFLWSQRQQERYLNFHDS